MTWTLTINQIALTQPTITLTSTNVDNVTGLSHLEFSIGLPTTPTAGDVLHVTNFDQMIDLGGPGAGRGHVIRASEIAANHIKLLLDPFYDGAYSYKIYTTGPDGTSSPSATSAPCVFSVSSTGPTVSAVEKTATTTTTADFRFDTNQASGTASYVITNSVTPPTAAQIIAGHNHLGAAALWAGSQAISTVGTKTGVATGLPAGVSFLYIVHRNALGLDSNIPYLSWGQGGAGWLPSNIGTANKLWLNAQNAASIIQSGGFITAWNDSGPSAQNMTTAAPNRPTYQATGFDGTRPGVRFQMPSGTSDPQWVQNTAFTLDANVYTIIFAGHVHATHNGYGRFISLMSEGDSNDIYNESFAVGSYDLSTIDFTIGTNVILITFPIVAPDTPMAYVIIGNGTQIQAWKAQGGAFVSTGAAVANTTNAGDSPNFLRIGCHAAAPSLPTEMTVGDIVISNFDETGSLTDIYTYLKTKWPSLP